ncbi:hypothetical protein [Rhodococcoides fascians]|uniref:hypothetical protein n=1 Tax=Rhodococcoides fascians TaxID=1828 RepID=UPI001179F979|nr:hypothetical protein [Rhodococcus fascians]
MMLREPREIDWFLLAGVVTIAEAQQLQSRPAHRSVAWDLRDNLLIDLCAYPLGEAGPRSGLAELEVFGRAIERERAVWERELDDRVGRHMIDVAGTVTRESREQGRWDMLLPLGSPSINRWQAAINVLTRVVSSRTVDGYLHPVLAANWLKDWPINEPSNDPTLPGVRTISSAGELFTVWQEDRPHRSSIEQQMMATFRTGTWP